MKLLFKVFLGISLLFLSIKNLEAQSPCKEMYFSLPENISEEDFIQNKVFFKLKNSDNIHLDIAEIEKKLAHFEDISIKKTFPNKYPLKEKTNERGEKLVDLSLIYELTFNPSKNNISCIINKIYESRKIVYAEPYYLPKLSFIPNDSLIFSFIQYDAGIIKAYDAWNISWGDTNVVIAIVDTGTDTNHVELKGNIYFNENDPINGIDDDGDGFVDNYFGWNTGSDNYDAQATTNFHGLHVAGISSSVSNNNIGRAGIGFKTKYLPVKIIDSQGRLSGAYQGIVYAADMGCGMINCSWGSNNRSFFAEDVVNYATFNKNALVLGGSGNNSNNIPFYPAAYLNAVGVAATGNADTKWTGSNFGSSIDIAAPGEDIVSCWLNGTYTNSSGTSMSAPVAAGVAAMIKAVFPNYSALQIRAQMQETADNVDAANPDHIGQLGAGRVNMFRAITDSTTPGVLMIDYQITDNDDDAFIKGDTLSIGIKIKNYLKPVNSLQASISSVYNKTEIIEGNKTFPALSTFDEADNFLDGFKVRVKSDIEKNALEEFKITLTDGVYTKVFYVQTNVNVDYLNINTGKIKTTIASNGRIGFGNTRGRSGLGFIYKDTIPLLYEAGIIMGNSNFQISSNVRGTSDMDMDFYSFIDVNRNNNLILSDDDIHGLFNDDLSGFPLNIDVRQEAFSWKQAPDDRFVIFNYLVYNNTNQKLSNYHFGIMADWDIGDYSKNRATFDSSRKLAYAWNIEDENVYAGIQLLHDLNGANTYHYAIDNGAGGAGGIDISIGFLKADKFTSISSNRPIAGQGNSGNDILHVISSGPHEIEAGDSLMFTFAFFAADSLLELQTIADDILDKINNGLALNTENKIVSEKYDWKIYPNPANGFLQIENISNELANNSKLKVYDLSGRIILESSLANQSNYLNISNLNTGVYLIEILNESKIYRTKFIKN
jgi:serine protease